MSTAYFSHESFIKHDFPGHPEHAGRIQAVWRQLQADGLLDQLLQFDPEPASDASILAAHDAAHLERLTVASRQAGMTRLDADTYFTPDSLGAARHAAGAVMGAVDAVLEGSAENAMAVARPPGHHATPGRAMGFCLLNNIAIGARHAQTRHGLNRVLIFDYDVHHGNGTQDIFYADPSLLFASIHQSPFYPGTGALEERGAGAGRGATLNLPLPGGHGDAAYSRLLHEVIEPAVARFQPELILVSAGFDAHWVDPLASMRLTLAGYDSLARACLELAARHCGGRVVFVMEGGYDLRALAHGWGNIARALLGIEEISDPYGAPPGSATPPSVDRLIERARRIHRL